MSALDPCTGHAGRCRPGTLARGSWTKPCLPGLTFWHRSGLMTPATSTRTRWCPGAGGVRTGRAWEPWQDGWVPACQGHSLCVSRTGPEGCTVNGTLYQVRTVQHSEPTATGLGFPLWAPDSPLRSSWAVSPADPRRRAPARTRCQVSVGPVCSLVWPRPKPGPRPPEVPILGAWPELGPSSWPLLGLLLSGPGLSHASPGWAPRVCVPMEAQRRARPCDRALHQEVTPRAPPGVWIGLWAGGETDL